MKAFVRTVACALALLLSAGAPAARAEDAVSQEAVARLMRAIKEDTGEARASALIELTALGPGTIRHIGQRLPYLGDDVGWEALAGALAAMGPERAVGELLAEGSTWPADLEERLHEVAGRLRETFPDERKTVVTLQRAVLDDPRPTPIAWNICLEPTTAGFARLVPGEAIVEVAGNVLHVDTDGEGGPDQALTPGKPRTLVIVRDGKRRDVVFFHVLGQWRAAPASALVGKLGKDPVVLLDANLDGRFDGVSDFIRIGDTAFVPLVPQRRFPLAETMAGYQLRQDGEAWSLTLFRDSTAAWVTERHRAAVVCLNRWRARAGLPPVPIDRNRSRAAGQHARYMELNDTFGHESQQGNPGWTKEGADAGLAGSLSHMEDPVRGVERLSATVVHRLDLVGPARAGIGVGFSKAGSVFVGGLPDMTALRTSVVVPGPGVTGVPVEAVAELPEPDLGDSLWSKPRGYPISIYGAGLREPLGSVEVQLYAKGRGKALPGTLFTYTAPYRKSLKQSGPVHFVPDQPLRPKTEYVVRVLAKFGDEPVDLQWSFKTGTR